MIIGTVRERLYLLSRRVLPWAWRSDVVRAEGSIALQIEALRADTLAGMEHQAREGGARLDHLDRQLARLSSDLTNLIGLRSAENAKSLDLLASDLTDLVGLRFAENAESHDLLANRVASASSEIETTRRVMSARVEALTTLVTPFVSGALARRRRLHESLVWYPAWSSLAPLESEPLVSVIVATRDRQSMLETALASLECQTYSNWEAIVVNDGSTDGTGDLLRELAKRDSRIRLFETGGLGCAGARQYGLDRADGEVIAYLDDDNLMATGWLRAVIEVLGRRPELSGVYGGQLRENDALEPWLLLEPFDEVRLLEGNFIDIGAFAHRPIEGIVHRSDVPGLEDWDFIVAFSERHSIAPVPVIASVYLTRALGRLSVEADHHESEERVRSRSVRNRLADPAFVDRSIRSLSEDTALLGSADYETITANDGESLELTVRNLARRSDDGLRMLEWAMDPRRASVGERLRQLGVGGRWVVFRPGEVGSSNPYEPGFASLDLDGLTADPGRVAAAVDGPASITSVLFDRSAIADDRSSAAEASADQRYVTMPGDLGMRFDVVIIGGLLRRECLPVARRVLANRGVVLLHEVQSSGWVGSLEEFASWRAIGDEFWIGSMTPTDFTDVVPIRALLRGIRRLRES